MHESHGVVPVTAGTPTHALLLASTFVIAVCGLVYELLAGAVSSYLLGDSVYQFSIVIGLFMASMGLGSYVSRFVTTDLVDVFVALQVAVGLAGGFSAYMLFYAFALLDSYTPVLFLACSTVGILVGLEIPLVVRILRGHTVLKLNLSNVLTLDYLGALCASLLFPIVLVPQLGLLRTAVFFGLMNVLVAALALYVLRAQVRRVRGLAVLTAFAGAALLTGLAATERVWGLFENRLYSGEVVFARTTPYQRLVLTRDGAAVSLFINGALQFNSLDEYRYHEALVHPAMSLALRRAQVLVLGGGDGMALREVLKYADVEQVTLVDLDPAVTGLFSTNDQLRALNGDAFADPRVQVVNEDAWKFLEGSNAFYDVVIADLPDPHDLSLSRLYSRAFYRLVARHLGAAGVMVTQATSPMFAREAFWCIAGTLAATPSPVGVDTSLGVLPYHAYVPSFGEWGFVLASPRRLDWSRTHLRVPTRFLDRTTLEGLAVFPRDMGPLQVEVNTLRTHALVGYYERGWSTWYR